jgi:hypothetical protein
MAGEIAKMQIVPLAPVPNQTVTVNLAGQHVQIDVFWKYGNLFANIWLSNTLLLSSVICLDRVRMVRNSYFGFTGDLGWVDQNGTSDPYYSEIGSRFLLYYLEASDIGTATDV